MINSLHVLREYVTTLIVLPRTLWRLHERFEDEWDFLGRKV